MKTVKLLLLCLALAAGLILEAKPKVRILATGGTIAGISDSSTSSAYKAGQVGIQTLLAAVPQVQDLAEVSGEQFANMASQDMTDAIWLQGRLFTARSNT